MRRLLVQHFLSRAGCQNSASLVQGFSSELSFVSSVNSLLSTCGFSSASPATQRKEPSDDATGASGRPASDADIPLTGTDASEASGTSGGGGGGAASAVDEAERHAAVLRQLRQPPPAQLLQVVPTPEGATRERLLVRDFIQNSLYHPTLGYFNAPTPPVGSGGGINYWKIYCKDEFDVIIHNKYKELETSFLTPAEMFSPWYGACIARHMVEHRRHHLGMEGQPLHIVEVGGGNGTLARDVLDWLRDHRPSDYRQTSYTCLEISTSLAARQYDKVVVQGGHGGRFHLRRGSGLDPATWAGIGGGPAGSSSSSSNSSGSSNSSTSSSNGSGSGSGGSWMQPLPAPRWEHTFVLMMEVLDNLPHDRVFRRRASEPWLQTVIRPSASSSASSQPSSSQPSSSSSSSSQPSMESGPWREAAEPLSDPLLARTLAAVYRPPSREQQLDERFNRVLDFILARDAQPASRDEVLWLPTAAAAFMELLHAVRPNHSLIAADFDKLPDVRLAGRNAPLVAEKVGGRNIDHDSLFVPWGTADIFFPTDFDALASLYKAAAEHVWGPGGVATNAWAAQQAAAAAAAAAASAAAASAGSAAAVGSGAGSARAPPPGTAPTAAAAAGQPGATGTGSGLAGTPSGTSEPQEEELSNLGEVNAEHFRQGAVIKRYREMFNTATICAFNPMVDDFVNARFFFGDSKGRLPPGTPRPTPQPSKPRLPTGQPAPGTLGIKSHIPAAPASRVRGRSQQQQQQAQVQQQKQSSEPVLGGKRRGGGGGGGVGGSGGVGGGSVGGKR
eukprot:XP_001693843.1 predicted protein [Chlamydomonas reinhardtii]